MSDTRELLTEVRRLQRIKKKNEAQLSEDELQGRYKNAYERLCGSIKEKQCELRAEFIGIIRDISDIMANSVYCDPDEVELWLKEVLVEMSDSCLKDPLAAMLFKAIYDFSKENSL